MNRTVVICCLNREPGGIDRNIGERLKAGSGAGFSLVLLCRASPEMFNEPWIGTRAQVIRLGGGAPRWSVFDSLSCLRKIGTIVHDHGVALLSAHEHLSLFHCALAKRLWGRRVLLLPTVHQLSVTKPLKGWRKSVLPRLEGIFLRQADHVVTVAEQRRRQVIELGVPSSRVTTIRNGVEGSRAFPQAAEKQAAKQRFSTDPDLLTLGYAGRLSPEKGVSDLLGAAVATGRPGKFRILIAGSGPQEPELRRFCSDNALDGVVTFLGFRSDLSDFYRALDVLVLPSYDEGISMALLEGMNLGLPVIATRVGGTPELVVHEKTGLLVEPGDQVKLAAALRKCVEDRALVTSWGRAAYDRIQDEFLIDHTINRNDALWRSLYDERFGEKG